jgi:TM2 domain-containing membrane protein YozV
MYEVSTKSRTAALLFYFLLGAFGAHRFYVGRWFTAILFAITGGGLLVWALVDFILIVSGSFKDKNGCRVMSWAGTPCGMTV